MLRAMLNDDQVWLEEYMVEPQDETTAWLTHAMLAGVEDEGLDPRSEWALALVEDAVEAARGYRLNKRLPDWWAERARKHTGFLAGLEDPLDLGMDIGRTRDLSVIWLLRRGACTGPRWR